MLHMFSSSSVVSLLYKLNPFRPSPSHSATYSQSFRFSVKIFSRSALAGRRAEKFLLTGPRTRSRRPWRRVANGCSYTSASPLCLPSMSWSELYRFFHSVIHRKSLMHQQNTINEDDKIIRNKYILNNMKTVIWGLHGMTVWKAGLLGFCAMCLGNSFQTFRRNVPPSSSKLWVNSRTHNPEDEGGRFLRNVGKQLTNNTAQQPRKPVSSMRKQVFN